MMKIMRKMMAAALIACLSLSLLAGCGSKPAEGETPADDGQTQQPADNQPAQAASGEELAQLLFDNKIAQTTETILDEPLFAILDIPGKLPGTQMMLDTQADPMAVDMYYDTAPEDLSGVQAYAVLLLALIEDAETVEWSYPANEDGTATMSANFTIANANYVLGGTKDIKECAQSPEDILALLTQLGLA